MQSINTLIRATENSEMFVVLYAIALIFAFLSTVGLSALMGWL